MGAVPGVGSGMEAGALGCTGFGPGAVPSGAAGLLELSSAFCSSHQVATTLLGWPLALGGQAGGPGQFTS